VQSVSPVDRRPGPVLAATLVSAVCVGCACAVGGLIGALDQALPLAPVGAIGFLVAVGAAAYLWKRRAWGLGAIVVLSFAWFVFLFALGWLEGLVRRDLRDDQDDLL
jgi:hypothetical protein